MYRRFLFFLMLCTLSIGYLPAQQASTLPQAPSLARPLPWAEQAQEAAPVPVKTVHNEDWSVLEVDRDALPMRLALVMATYETPMFTRELVRVEWRAGDPIDLYVVRPHGVERPPVILNLYGYPSETERFRNDGWCRRATEGGFAAVGFVSALTGDRYSNRPMKEWFVSELQESLGKSTHDVQRILDYLASRGDLSMKDVSMYGQGSGGTIAVLAAQADPRITVLDLVNPWGDWPDWLKDSPQVPESERAAYLKQEFLERVAHLDPMTYLPQLKLKGLRVQQVMDDIITPPSARNKLAGAIPKPALVSYPTTPAQLKELRTGGLWGWMKAKVREPASTAIAATSTAAP
jgi:hypothetical protein